MRIHIVARDYTSDQILARLAAHLADDKAFTIGDHPDPGADMNYYFPYLEWERFPDWHETPIAAWFTHLDADRPSKVATWNKVAQAVDLRLTCAPQYADMLRKHGETELVTPPLDRAKFAPQGDTVKDRESRVIGTSGFVYPGGRKGEDVFKRLILDYPQHTFTASGHGWDCTTVRYAWDDMQTFYHNLDVYVCTSSIEGIGYGPLEAMACGVPVVIPRGVGVFDGLPDLENIHRYDVGDYDSLRKAVDTALSRLDELGLNVASLRGATARYTVKAWHETHLKAFERYLYDVPAPAHHHPWHGRAGVYYVAYGDPARECAARAIKSFKKYMPEGIEVALASDKPLNAGEDVFIQNSDEDIGGRSVKTKIYDLAPDSWDYVLYLDADTEVVADISFLFQILEDGWDAFFCINPAKYVLASLMSRPDNQDEIKETFDLMGSDQMLQLNGGVFGFRRGERTARFFRAWHTEWARYGKRDQAALDRVLYSDPIRVYVLGNEFNTITRYIDADRTAGILHFPMSARRWRGVINGRLDGTEAWAALHPGGKA